jgi:hypothetical protein
MLSAWWLSWGASPRLEFVILPLGNHLPRAAFSGRLALSIETPFAPPTLVALRFAIMSRKGGRPDSAGWLDDFSGATIRF